MNINAMRQSFEPFSNNNPSVSLSDLNKNNSSNNQIQSRSNNLLASAQYSTQSL